MNIRRIGVPIAIAATAALAISGCTTAPPAESPSAVGQTVTIAEVNEVSSFNTASSEGNVDINSQLAYFTQAGFFYLDDSASVVYDESFGTVEQLSEDPLSIKYTVNDGVVWSDGEAFDADDMILAWAAASGYYDEGETTYFTPAGSTVGLDLTSYPEIGDDGRSITLTFSGPYADWSLFQPTGVPAHVVAEGAGVEGSLLDVLTDGPAGEEVRAVADFWNTGFDTASLPSNASLYLATGPFVLSAWDAGQSVTLAKNDAYTGDLAPEGIDEIVIRFIADPNAQVTALQNGEVDIINPQASGDILTTLDGIDGITTLTGPTGSYDHIDLNFGSAVFEDAAVREAFLKTIPRDQIVDALIRPLDPEAGLLDSQIFFTGVDGYDEAVAANGSADFAEVDIEGAKALLNGATPTVRLAYNNANPNRVDAFLAIQSSAQEAGFIVEDTGLAGDAWGGVLTTQPEAWDAFIFGWSTVGAGVSGVPQLFHSTGGGNYNNYSNAQVDALATELSGTVDPERQVEIQVEIDTLLWADHYGLPMWIAPGVIAHDDRVQGVAYNTWQTGPIWNFWEWTVAE